MVSLFKMKYFSLIFFIILLSACEKGTLLTPKQIKIGHFKTTINNTDYTSEAFRDEHFQIEIFENKKDTFAIKWKNNFEYSLLKLHPKNNLDSTEFIIKITGIHKNYYTFRAHFKGSEYKQEGKAIKLDY
jgi:uncharacterized protein YdhG (YjbR/CyaY superfamily)